MGWSLPEVSERAGTILVTVGLSVDYYPGSFHWTACGCAEITNNRVTFATQLGHLVDAYG